MTRAALLLLITMSCDRRTLVCSKTRADIPAIESALTEWSRANGGRYPATLDVLITPDENGETYLDARVMPLDPWGREYLYDPPRAAERRLRVYTLGKDGQPGGTGQDADVDNWSLKGPRVTAPTARGG